MNINLVITSLCVLTLGFLSSAESSDCSEANCKGVISLKELPVEVKPYEGAFDASRLKMDVIPKTKALESNLTFVASEVLVEKILLSHHYRS